jgi:hypothetical protein
MEICRFATVSPYILEGSTRNTARKDFKKDTFKAGMCMKTNKTWTKCPEKSRTFTANRPHFCKNRSLVAAICHFNLVFQGFLGA